MRPSSLAKLATAIALVAGPSVADGHIRSSDQTFTQADLDSALRGQVMEFFTGGFATYRADGTYDYRYEVDGERVTGQWSANDASQVCIAFDNGFDRCDTIVRAGDRLVMIIENGERYPARELTPIEADS